MIGLLVPKPNMFSPGSNTFVGSHCDGPADATAETTVHCSELAITWQPRRSFECVACLDLPPTQQQWNCSTFRLNVKRFPVFGSEVRPSNSGKWRCILWWVTSHVSRSNNESSTDSKMVTFHIAVKVYGRDFPEMLFTTKKDGGNIAWNFRILRQTWDSKSRVPVVGKGSWWDTHYLKITEKRW